MLGQSKESKKTFLFQSKSKTLDELKKVLETALVLEQVCFEVSGWQKNYQLILLQLKAKKWLEKKLIVRSSALAEDGDNNSFAGHFESVLNVLGETEIQEAIQKVIKSFSDKNPAN